MILTEPLWVEDTNSEIEVNCQFEDPNFRPIETSLSNESNRKQFKNVQWKRASEIFTSKLEVFKGLIEPADVKQGILDDCWLLSAIAALSKNPAIIQALFPERSRTVNKEGKYDLFLCRGGLWRRVTLDDYLPVTQSGQEMFARANDRELWVLLLEKAFAKISGNYQMLSQGQEQEAFMDLTGAPVRVIRKGDKDYQRLVDSGELWKILFRAHFNKYFMTVSSEDTVAPEKGLIGRHAYSILEVAYTSADDRIIKLRNPWGKFEWNSSWGDKCSRWTEDTQREVEPLIQADDGIFWMCIEDVVKHFDTFTICMVRNPLRHPDPWQEYRRPFYFSLVDDDRIDSPIFLMTVEHSGPFIFSVHQEDERSINSLPYIDIGISIFQQTSHKTKFLTGVGVALTRQSQTTEVSLSAGSYLVIPTSSGAKLKEFKDMATAVKRSAVLVIHGEVKFSIAKKRYDAELIREAHAWPILTSATVSSKKRDGKVVLFSNVVNGDDLSFLVQNNSKTTAHCTFKCNNEQLSTLRPLTVAAEEWVLPGQHAVLYHLFPKRGAYSADWSGGFNFQCD